MNSLSAAPTPVRSQTDPANACPYISNTDHHLTQSFDDRAPGDSSELLSHDKWSSRHQDYAKQ